MTAHTRFSIVRGDDERPIRWLGSALADLRRFPPGARQVAGYPLWRLQQGLDPDDWKPMPSIGPGVREMRVHTHQEHRVIYVTRSAEGICVLHAFEKRTRRTAPRDVQKARQRLGSLTRERRPEAER